jgi:casein kinase 1
VFYEYVKNLKFEEKPDYSFLKELLLDLSRVSKIDLDFKLYDWNIKISLIKNNP